MNRNMSSQYISSINILLFMAIIDLHYHILPSLILTLKVLAVASSSQPAPIKTADVLVNEFNSTQPRSLLSNPTFISTSLNKNPKRGELSLLSSQLSTSSPSKTYLMLSEWLSTTIPSPTIIPFANLDFIGNMAITSTPTVLRVVTKKSRMFRNNNNKHHHEHHWGPFFEQPLNSTTSGDNITAIAHLFTEAILNCRVGMLKDKTVMWVKRTADKVSLLTVGNVTYSSDPRLQVKFQYPNNWRLVINPTQWSDSGIYMCQVSTHPPRVFTTNLTIIEPPLRLIDDQERDFGDRYYKTGSTIDLQCQVSRKFLQKEKLNILQSLRPLNTSKRTLPSSYETPTSQYLYEVSYGMKKLTKEPKYDDSFKITNDYYKIFSHTNSKMQSRNTIEEQFNNVIVWSKDDEQLPSTVYRHMSMEDKWLTSRISIHDAQISDSGNYSCSIGRLFTAIVQVQVLTGESPAAVQHNSGHWIKSKSTKRQQCLKIYVTIILHILQFKSYN